MVLFETVLVELLNIMFLSGSLTKFGMWCWSHEHAVSYYTKAPPVLLSPFMLVPTLLTTGYAKLYLKTSLFYSFCSYWCRNYRHSFTHCTLWLLCFIGNLIGVLARFTYKLVILSVENLNDMWNDIRHFSDIILELKSRFVSHSICRLD